MTLGTHVSVVGNGIVCDNKSSSAVILVDEKCKALMSLVTHGNNYVLFEVYCSESHLCHPFHSLSYESTDSLSPFPMTKLHKNMNAD